MLPTTPTVTPQKLGYMEVARQVKVVISEIKSQPKDFPKIIPLYCYKFFAAWKQDIQNFWLFAALYVYEFY